MRRTGIRLGDVEEGLQRRLPSLEQEAHAPLRERICVQAE